MDKQIIQTAFGALLQIFIPISLRAGKTAGYIPQNFRARKIHQIAKSWNVSDLLQIVRRIRRHSR